MRKVFVYLLLALSFTSCKKIDEFFRKPPVAPVNRILKTSVIAGYAASVASAWHRGYSIPGVNIVMNKSTAVFYIDLASGFPFQFANDSYSDAVVLALKLTDEVSVLTVLLGESDIHVGNFKIFEIRTFPVIFEQNCTRLVFASQDINIGSDYYLEINLNSSEIDFELQRAEVAVPENELIAIDQNAWIIEVNDHQTPVDFSDDEYLISGGEQKIEVLTGEIPELSTLQMAMILAKISPQCSLNPTSGYVFMQNLGVSNSISKLVLAQVLMNFSSSCNGKVEVMAAFGNYIGYNGKKINLGLAESE